MKQALREVLDESFLPVKAVEEKPDDQRAGAPNVTAS
jgi:hypothetical protein